MEVQEPFFSLTPAEANVAVACVRLFTLRVEKDPNWPDPEFASLKESIEELFDKVYIKDLRESIPLDYVDCMVLQLAINDSVEHTHTIIQNSREQGKSPDHYQEALSMFQFLENEAPDVFLRLTLALHYDKASLATLENIFGIKTGVVPPLTLDNAEEIVTIKINQSTIIVFRFIFTILSFLKLLQHKSAFAKKLYAHQYIHLTDFNTVREKIEPLLEHGNSVGLTLYDSVVLYWLASLAQRVYISDIADYFTDSFIERDHIENYKRTRKYHLEYIDQQLSVTRKYLEDYEIAKPYLEMVNQWEIPMNAD